MGAAPAGCGAIWPPLDLPVSSLYFSFCYLGLSGALGIPNHHGERRDGVASPGLPSRQLSCRARPGAAPRSPHLLSSPALGRRMAFN